MPHMHLPTGWHTLGEDTAGGACRGRKPVFGCLLALMVLTSGGVTLPVAAGEVSAWPGRMDGSWHWQLPDTPNGLKPYVSWHATGSATNGDVYVAGMDHVTNSALYRLRAGAQAFRYVGDARSASEAAGNWRPGESAEKFHTRPTWHLGDVYVATMDYSQLDGGYLERRAFTGMPMIPRAIRSAMSAPANRTAWAPGTSASSPSRPIRRATFSMARPCLRATYSGTTSGRSERATRAGPRHTIA